MARALADDVELAFQRVRHGYATVPTDKYLPDHRLYFLHGFPEPRIVAGHVAPAEQYLAFLLDRAFNLVFAGESRCRLLGQKHHPDAILARWRKDDVPAGHFFAQECVRNLQQDAGTVTRERIGADGAAMRQILEYLQPLLDDRVGFLALDMGNEPDATSVVFVGRVIKPLGQRWLTHVLPRGSKKAGWTRAGCLQ